MINHEHRLLSKAAADVEGRISVKRDPDRSWPGDHSRLCALENDGHLRWVGEQAGPHLGGTFATWQITDQGRSTLPRTGSTGSATIARAAAAPCA
ncbi:hypothetical protein [Methylobacterium oryzihabitans]|uniref:Uncharacterized protein n=1 Tax=Methylobacterium oryzihabitans TaxID=2499852 RepID=A0A3S2VK07_9HYPH|nr:hypothetical protein [Methylobacterium oryzihabitans]RVU14621.1 hypothetical protein EOE48_22180 [Methylobacterium oryzihabitans]